MKSCEKNLNMQLFDLTKKKSELKLIKKSEHRLFSFGLPLIIVLFVAFGFADLSDIKSSIHKNYNREETKGGQLKNTGKFNILSSEDITLGIKDTVYTDKECWLELRIDQQMLYQHWRNGLVEKYPISSGNNKGGDPEALESRPGLFAIFHKEEHHISSQFGAANMYHFMPFNQGIGFHSIDGTGYYGHLGVRPSSHGCIRMKHSDAEKLFRDCEKGTLVLANKGVSARTIAFAPKDFKNEKEFTKEDYKLMLGSNLYNLMNKRYYLEEREKFIIDPKVIPTSGIYISYDRKIPDNQIVPRSFVIFTEKRDRILVNTNNEILGNNNNSDELVKLISNNFNSESTENKINTEINSTEDIVKKYFNNPIGVLPYFGPKK